MQAASGMPRQPSRYFGNRRAASDGQTDIIKFNVKANGWKNILFVGRLPDPVYDIAKHLQLTFSVIDPDAETPELQADVQPYASKIVIINCKDFEVLEDSLGEAISSPYWNPHAQLILYYHTRVTNENAKIFFIFWFYMIVNAVIVQYDDSKELLLISYYNPYVSENNKFENMHGCWKTTKVGRPVVGYKQSFVCEEDCHNITLHSKLRALHLGTCIGYNTHYIRYGDIRLLRQLNVFKDISKDLRGYVMKTNGFEVLPFLEINEESDGSYSLGSRDGLVWKTLSELMNFTINFDACKDILKKPFNYKLYIELTFSFAARQADLFICPVYQFDLVFIKVDLSCEYKASGVCILSHRSNFETVLFDVKLFQQNSTLIIQFVVCFLCIWLTFYIHNVAKGLWSFDQFGKDFINTIRNVLSIGLYKPPMQRSFRMFLIISIWCFFILNFSIQATIVSFFSAYKRGKDVDTFEDVLEKGYAIEALVSPDMILPDTEDLYRKINSRVKPLMNMFDCVDRLANDSERFCLIDCSTGLYLERNRLNEKGVQYLHVARKNRMHSNYLSLVLHENSPLTARINKYLRWFVEVGLIQKWEQYRFTEIKEDFPVKPLSMKDMLGIFECFYLLLGDGRQ
ncbi:uncharacterized protein LOC113235933 [Hyposmocoma kahamanoa]|uniref:uncharacterized protein LOC113235933 n=1 Tax=Hyposmocoma kahamanoa TaxID=1477025 RepID=UPI000E6D90CE|nr:uncharacterized protein LOC113235933 [Hyposmocoma kahamanoa]